MSQDLDCNYVAVIADLKGSRRYAAEPRHALQFEMEAFLRTMDERFRGQLASEFVVTTGDEFQGLLRSPEPIVDLVWEAWRRFPGARFRWGIGWGRLTTALQPRAVGMDGPAFHAAREAIRMAKKGRRYGGVFLGFGQTEDFVLTALADLLDVVRCDMKPRQIEVVSYLRDGLSQRDVASALEVTPQTVNASTQGAFWSAYRTGEHALRAYLETATATLQESERADDHHPSDALEMAVRQLHEALKS